MSASPLQIYRCLEPQTKQLLRHLTWLAPEPIPASLLQRAQEFLPSLDSRDPLEILQDLVEKKLAAWNEDRSAISLDSSVQTVPRFDFPSDGAAPAELVATLHWVNANFLGDPEDVRSWPALDLLVSHVTQVAGHAADFGIARPTVRLLNSLGSLLHERAKFSLAEPLLRRALSLAENSNSDQMEELGVTLSNLALLLRATNRMAEAEPLYRRALRIDEASYGPDHPEVATDLNNLAGLLYAMNRLAEAEPLSRRHLEIFLRFTAATGHRHPHLLEGMRTYAIFCQALEVPAEETSGRLMEMGAEAGLGDEMWEIIEAAFSG